MIQGGSQACLLRLVAATSKTEGAMAAWLPPWLLHFAAALIFSSLFFNQGYVKISIFYACVPDFGCNPRCTQSTQLPDRTSTSQSLDSRHPFSNNNPYLDLDSSISTASTMSRQITPLQQAYLDAYAAACALVPHNLRRQVILFSGAASIAHGILDRKAKDVDILVGVEALAILDDAIINMREGFHRDHNGTIKWDKCDLQNNKLFEVTVEFVEIRGPFAPRIPEVVGFGEGYVVTLTELVQLRASTFVERGDESDHIDFFLLLSWAVKQRVKLPHLGEEELGSMIEAVEMCEESRDTDVLFMDVLGSFELRGARYESWVEWVHLGLQ